MDERNDNGGIPDSSSRHRNSGTGRSKRPKPIPEFPRLLYDMIEGAEEGGYSHIFSWMPDGKSFKSPTGARDSTTETAIVSILKQSDFTQTKVRSFLRQLNNYGFVRIKKGPRQGECWHKFFVRGNRHILEDKTLADFQGKIRGDEDEVFGEDEDEDEDEDEQVFDRYEHGTRRNGKQQARLEVHKSAVERHRRETAKSLSKKYEREGKVAVQDQQMKDLLKQDKRVSDPKIMAKRVKDERVRQEEKEMRPFGPRRGKRYGHQHYDADTRKRMTTIALLCIKHLGHASISRDSMIKLSDVLIRRCWNSNLLPETTKKDIGGLDEHNKNYPRRFLKEDICKWIDFFTFQQEGAPRTHYFFRSVRTISNETVVILPDEEARRIALELRASWQAKAKMAGSSETPFLVLCDYLLTLLFDPSKEVGLKSTAERLKWW